MGAVAKTLFFGGNWKAAMTPAKTKPFFDLFLRDVSRNSRKIRKSETKIMIAPPATCLPAARESIKHYLLDDAGIMGVVKLGVQDPWHRSGAYTGATTFEMAKDPLIGAEYAIIGHSENREPWRMISGAFLQTAKVAFASLERSAFGEAGKQDMSGLGGAAEAALTHDSKLDSDKPLPLRIALDGVVNVLVRSSFVHHITPILCVGETLEERKDGITMKVVEGQLREGLKGLQPDQIEEVIIAYEPIWAIGTGETATPEQAQEVHAKIASILNELTGTKNNKLLYGGSMNEKNVAALVSQPDIHGGLIGGASLKPKGFMELIMSGINAVSG